jgi:hypothetical protein
LVPRMRFDQSEVFVSDCVFEFCGVGSCKLEKQHTGLWNIMQCDIEWDCDVKCGVTKKLRQPEFPRGRE